MPNFYCISLNYLNKYILFPKPALEDSLASSILWYLLQVTGPSNATVQYFNYAQNSTSSYQLLVQWDDTYRGNVSVDLQTNRCVQTNVDSCLVVPCVIA